MAPNHIKFKGSNFFFFKENQEAALSLTTPATNPPIKDHAVKISSLTSIRTGLTLSITCFICRENVGNQETQLKKLKLDSLSLF